jgi:hypothetical protein
VTKLYPTVLGLSVQAGLSPHVYCDEAQLPLTFNLVIETWLVRYFLCNPAQVSHPLRSAGCRAEAFQPRQSLTQDCYCWMNLDPQRLCHLLLQQ